MAQKPSIPKGTRDFNPEQVEQRNYIFNTIKTQFKRFGFMPIETPSFENSSTLMGKYGEEGDRLIFKILNSGDYLANYNKIFIDVSNLLVNIYKKAYTKFLTDNSFLKYNESVISDIAKKCSSKLKEDKSSFEIVLSLIDKREKQIIGNLHNLKNQVKNENVDFEEAFSKLKLNSINKVSSNIVKELFYNIKFLTKEISEKALRYDLTVPFARYVVQHQNEITFPFKRYQIQPVWRADRPQKGRFREFYQCDADVVGSDSLLQEVEFIQLYDAVFTALQLNGVTIKINNRKILSGIAEVIGAKDKLIDFTVALDKLDKIGEEKVKAEMLSKGISEAGITALQPLFNLSGSFGEQIESLKNILQSSEEGLKGIEELEFINTAITQLGLQTATLQLDVTLARGLNYYTGAIFEVAAPEGVTMGSIGGGGRYDDLTGIFGLKNVSGVGISFGLDRIYLVLEELNLFPESISKSVDVLFINFGTNEALYSLKAIQQLREQGVNAELYPDAAKMKKQMSYANKNGVKYVVLVGDKELESNTYTLKNMQDGSQEPLSFTALQNELLTTTV